MLKLVMQPSFRAVGQTHAEWQTFEKLGGKKRQPQPSKKKMIERCSEK